ncbi:MAG TPA: hypothetical protein PLB01_04310 [Thermoanaerobaculia bacterium]|nr:hypothetical protein [Thermoanaerobaculia bacterium]
MSPESVLGTITGYCLSIFGAGAFVRTARATGSPDDLRAIRRRLILIGFLTFAAAALFLRQPTLQDWAQFGFLFSAIANSAFLLAMFLRLRVLSRV